jgi:hypothetical protein
VNLEWFPHTAPANYWTATEFASDRNKAWMIHFYFGENNSDNKNSPAYVRLVSPASEEQRGD